MSNLERDPDATWSATAVAPARRPEIIEAREVPLGGPRAMTVHRTLPSRERTLIGAWCFIDHYGPSPVSETGGMVVPPHPHTGLQTVSWLFSGEIEHRDSVGSHAFVRPGELNLMTAGRGISHSEMSTPASDALHGVQLWVALPSESRSVEPFFETTPSVLAEVDDALVRVFIGSLAGASTEVTTFSELVAAEITLSAAGSVELPLRPEFEHGVLVDAGPVTVSGVEAARTELVFLGQGAESVRLSAGPEPVRVVLIGGVPLGEQILMWWNFVGRSHDEVVEYRSEWQREAGFNASPAAGAAWRRFGATDHHYEGTPLPAPELPGVRLKPRAR
ncbi:pirin family protein [Cnuibacter physcomitrellae]|uniref:pirin family protein n=1 Tax=Cnuibacter physcomitrellae TaxID=1619308 RepID=UPI002175BB85|nr:pirin family protein [Cnuibacter physcomitrellae]MCS5498969.1 pirin family protein [Cnuibacter physcomitrellae]